MSLERITSRVKETKVLGVPIGDAMLLLIGLGVSEAIVPVLTRFVKFPIISGAGIGVIAKLPAIERLLGPTAANVISATALATGLDHQIALRDKIQTIVSSIVGKISPVATSGAITSGVTQPISLGQADVSEQERRILETLRVRR